MKAVLCKEGLEKKNKQEREKAEQKARLPVSEAEQRMRNSPK